MDLEIHKLGFQALAHGSDLSCVAVIYWSENLVAWW